MRLTEVRDVPHHLRLITRQARNGETVEPPESCRFTKEPLSSLRRMTIEHPVRRGERNESLRTQSQSGARTIHTSP